MKIKQSTFYAMRILNRIYYENDRVITSKKIAEKEEISQGVVLQILRKLSKAGLVCVYQGRGEICGGFTMAKDIDDITMADVMETMEEIDICSSLEIGIREREELLYQICSQINDGMRELFSNYTIRELFGTEEAGITYQQRKRSEEKISCT